MLLPWEPSIEVCQVLDLNQEKRKTQVAVFLDFEIREITWDFVGGCASIA